MPSYAEIALRETYPEPFTQEQIVDAAFKFFREVHGFPYRNLPLHVCMQEVNALTRMHGRTMLRNNAAYHVCDTYHPHRFEGHANGKISPIDCFNDDRRLKRAIEFHLGTGSALGEDYFTTLNLVLGTQTTSNFRPAAAAYFYRKYCPNKNAVVFDPSTGYGGRLVGAMGSGVVAKYIGVDPHTRTHEGNLRMARDLGWKDRVALFNLPAEDVLPKQILKDAPQGVDLSFSSPPYYRKEEYTEEATQSWVRYTTAKDWYRGFMKPYMRLQFAVLKPGCKAVINIAPVNYKGKRYPLDSWCIQAAKAVGFKHVATSIFHLQVRVGVHQEEGVMEEPLLIFEKPA